MQKSIEEPQKEQTNDQPNEGHKTSESPINDTETKFELQKIHPGMHNLRPHAYYPAWRTAELPAGTYLFATTVFFSTKEKPQAAPEVRIDGNTVTVRFGDTERTVTV